MEELRILEQLAAFFSQAGPYGIVAYLVWRDIVQPRRSGKRNGNGDGNGNGHAPFARESDVANLAQSFREYRADSWKRLEDLGDRLSRIEGRLHGSR